MTKYSDGRIVGVRQSVVNVYRCCLCKWICDHFLLLPNCGHSYCHSCITEMTKTNRKCSVCQTKFARLKTYSINSVYTKHNNQWYVFTKNLVLNEAVSHLTINCDFSHYGCEEVIELGSLSSHVLRCPHRYHKKFGQRLKDLSLAVKELRYKNEMFRIGIGNLLDICRECEDLEQMIREFTKKVDKLSQKMSDIGLKKDLFFRYVDHTNIGTYKTTSSGLEVDKSVLKLMNINSNQGIGSKSRFQYHIAIPFIEIEEILYCIQTPIPLIFIRPNIDSSEKIKDCINLGRFSPNYFKLDINSKELKERYIKVVVYDRGSDLLMKFLSFWPKTQNPSLRFEIISESESQSLV